jgi:transglutaminase-like putative cysteine protease
MGMTWDGQALWVADRKVNTLFKLGPLTGQVLATLPTPGYRPTGLAFDGKYLWVADRDQDSLFRLEPSTGLVDKVFRVPAKSPRGLAWDGEFLFLADGKDDLIYVIDPSDGATVRTIPAPHRAITGLTFDGKRLWAADRAMDEIYMVAPERGDVLGIIESPGPHPWGLAWDGARLWHADYQTRKIYAINVQADRPYQHLEDRTLRVEQVVNFHSQGPDELDTVDFFLAVPVSRYHQTILDKPHFSPPPRTLVADRWGQQIAHFRQQNVKPGTFLQPRIAVDAVLHKTRFWILPEQVKPLSSIPRDIRRAYLQDGSKYRLKDPIIIKAAREAVGDEKRPYWMARKIYHYVRDKLDYKLTAPGWDSAPLLLERGTGSCSEYSFVFIALCRANRIPARYVGGVVTRGDDAFVDNVFHRWAEIYLPGIGWIPVDPDRGDKKTPRGIALGFGNLDNTMLVTTVAGGESEYLDWKYNGNVKWTFRGRTQVYVEHIGELAPLGEIESLPEEP